MKQVGEQLQCACKSGSSSSTAGGRSRVPGGCPGAAGPCYFFGMGTPRRRKKGRQRRRKKGQLLFLLEHFRDILACTPPRLGVLRRRQRPQGATSTLTGQSRLTMALVEVWGMEWARLSPAAPAGAVGTGHGGQGGSFAVAFSRSAPRLGGLNPQLGRWLPASCQVAGWGGGDWLAVCRRALLAAANGRPASSPHPEVPWRLNMAPYVKGIGIGNAILSYPCPGQ